MVLPGDDIGAQVIAAAARINRVAGSLDRVGRIIMSTGRGGTGKSTFVALLARYLRPPLLLLDIDPDQSLATMLGVDIETARVRTEGDREVPVKTLSDLTHEIEEEDIFAELAGAPPVVKIPLLLRWYARYHSDRFDIFSLGPRWSEGDYRSANYLMEFVIPAIGQNYRSILIDSPAGLEHLNRRVVPRVNDLFIVLDPSRKSLLHIERVQRITREVGITYERLFLVGNYEFDEAAEQALRRTGLPYLGRMEYDADLRRYNLEGRSLLDLPDDSPACTSVRRIMEKAGYETA